MHCLGHFYRSPCWDISRNDKLHRLKLLFFQLFQSSNGTYLDGTKIVQRTEVLEGDLIGMGKFSSCSFDCHRHWASNWLLKVAAIRSLKQKFDDAVFNSPNIKLRCVVLGCNPDLYQIDSPKPDFLIFKASVMNEVVLIDSEDEQENEKASNNDNNDNNDDEDEAENVPESDIDKILDDIVADSGITNGHLVDDVEVINVSSDEETAVDKKWKVRLSQAKSPSPQRLSAELKLPKPIERSPLPTPAQSSPSSSIESWNEQIRGCEVRVALLSSKEVDEHIKRSKKVDESSEVKNDKVTAKVKRPERVLPSHQQKFVNYVETRKKLNGLIDSDTDDELPTPKKAKVIEPKAPSIDSSDDLECIRYEKSSKILIRRKSTSEKVTEERCKSSSPGPSGNISTNKKPEAAKELQKKPMPKRRMTICGSDDNVLTSSVHRKPVPIIEAPRMPKRRRSVVPQEQNAPKRRPSMSADMFNIASNLRREQPQRNYPIDEFFSSEDKEQRKKERNEKLRQVAEEKAEQKRKQELEKCNEAKADRVAVKPKVKITLKNRGEFLTNLPTPEVAKPVKNPFAPVSAKPPQKDEIANSERVLSILGSFRKAHVKRTVRAATVDNDGICNNLEFYKDYVSDVDVSLPIASVRCAQSIAGQSFGFYNPIQKSQQSQPPVLPSSAKKQESPMDLVPTLADFVEPKLHSILKFSKQTKPVRPKLNVRFPEDDSLQQIRIIKKEFPPLPDSADDDDQMNPSWSHEVVDENEAEHETPKQNHLRHPSISFDEYRHKSNNANAPAETSRPPKNVLPVGMIRPLLQIEEQTVGRLLIWDPQWLEMPKYSKPETFIIKPLQSSYKNLEEYRTILQPIIELDLLAKVTNCYMKFNEKEWKSLTLESVQRVNGVSRLTFIFDEFVRDYRQGSLLLLESRNHEKQQSERFFGYIASKSGQIIVVDTMCNPSYFRLVTIVKSLQIMYVRAELKSMIAIMNLTENNLVKNILDPSTIKTCDNYVPGPYMENPISPLNDMQLKIIRQIAREKTGILVIEGGPGTGKTKVIVASVLHIFIMAKKENRPIPNVLVCAMSNSCVDEIATALQPLCRHLEITLLRTGNPEKSNEAVLSFSLNHQAHFNRGDRSYTEAKKHFVATAKVILSTVNSSSELIDYGKKFEVCFIDEASQCTEAEILIPLQLKFNMMVLVGDKNQLQPAVTSLALKGFEYDKSLFERISNTFKTVINKPVLALKVQFRMHPEIFKFPNE